MSELAGESKGTEMTNHYEPTERTTVKRLPARGVYDRDRAPDP